MCRCQYFPKYTIIKIDQVLTGLNCIDFQNARFDSQYVRRQQDHALSSTVSEMEACLKKTDQRLSDDIRWVYIGEDLHECEAQAITSRAGSTHQRCHPSLFRPAPFTHDARGRFYATALFVRV